MLTRTKKSFGTITQADLDFNPDGGLRYRISIQRHNVAKDYIVTLKSAAEKLFCYRTSMISTACGPRKAVAVFEIRSVGDHSPTFSCLFYDLQTALQFFDDALNGKVEWEAADFELVDLPTLKNEEE